MSYAKRRGYTVSTNTPYVGGIVQTNESRAGHVAVVKKVVGKNIYIEERNYRCPGCLGTRVLSVDDPKVQGFIKPK